jgi:PIN domain nuclease of toxin-antitoxin system
VTILDAYALVAFLVAGPAAAQVRGILRDGSTAIVTANLAEALDVSKRIYGLSIERAMEVLDPLIGGTLTPIVVDVPLARRAAEVRAQHYHRSTRPISLADCCLLAAAGPDDRIATSDPDVLAVAAVEALQSIRLPAER